MADQTTVLSTEQADELLLAAVLTDEGRQDPYRLYAQLREGAPRWRSAAGSTVLTTYPDALEALRNPALGRAEADMELPATFGGRERRPAGTASMLMLNPPDHTRIRGLVSRAFTPRRVEALRPELEALLAPVLDRFEADGGGDVVAQLALPFPIAVISELLGVPREGNEHIHPLVHAITSLIDPAADDATQERGLAAAAELGEYFAALAEERRTRPDDGLFSALIRVEEEGDRLSPEELITNTILLYAAGFETTSNLIGNGLRLLLANPDQMALLRRRRELLPSAVMEMLRHDSPVQLNMRVALGPVEVLGEHHDRGAAFVVLQGSANHDAGVYADAERFDVARFHGGGAPQPLSFGWGAHHCLGAHLARAEGEIVMGALLERFERIELDDAALDGARPHFRPSFTLRGLESLPVSVG